MNMYNVELIEKSSQILSVLGNPFRIKILLTIGKGEACVCHLEHVLKKRQAYISQHLMSLRDAGLLETRREGKYIYYRLSTERIFKILRNADLIAGFPEDQLPQWEKPLPESGCDCPQCCGTGDTQCCK